MRTLRFVRSGEYDSPSHEASERLTKRTSEAGRTGLRARGGAALLAAMLVAATAWLLAPQTYVEVRNGETGEGYFAPEAGEGDTVRLSWTHSMEKTPWVEEYEVSGGELHLREVRIKSFGAGVNQIAPKVENADGWVVMSGYERSFPTLRFIHSRDVERKLAIAGKNVALDADVPQYASVEVGVENTPRIMAWLGHGKG